MSNHKWVVEQCYISNPSSVWKHCITLSSYDQVLDYIPVTHRMELFCNGYRYFANLYDILFYRSFKTICYRVKQLY